MSRRAFVTGGSGQAASHLVPLLLQYEYDVTVMVRRHANFESEIGHLGSFRDQIQIVNGDVTDLSSIESILSRTKPHDIYHLAAQSHVKTSFEVPHHTFDVNIMGTLNMLEATRRIVPYARFLVTSTSEMFGNQVDSDGFQRETTHMIPVSPYGISKLVGHNLIRQYRNCYDMYCCSAIPFNYESSTRGGNFVTQKVVRGAVSIKRGRQSFLELGNLEAVRDWSHAADAVNAMYLMLQQSEPDDYVVASGVTHTVHDLVQYVFDRLSLNSSEYVKIVDYHKRPEDVNYLCGDATKARTKLGWRPKYTFETMLDEMINAELVKP